METRRESRSQGSRSGCPTGGEQPGANRRGLEARPEDDRQEDDEREARLLNQAADILRQLRLDGDEALQQRQADGEAQHTDGRRRRSVRDAEEKTYRVIITMTPGQPKLMKASPSTPTAIDTPASWRSAVRPYAL